MFELNNRHTKCLIYRPTLSLIAVFAIAGLTISLKAYGSGQTYKDGEVIVKVRDAASSSSPNTNPAARAQARLQRNQAFLAKANRLFGVRGLHYWNGINLHHLQFDTSHGETVGSMIQKLKALPEVEYVEPNYILYKASVGSPEQVLDLQSSMAIGQGSTNPAVFSQTTAPIQASNAWPALNPSLTPVVVAVIDTGLQLNHPAFADAVWTNPGEIPNNGIDDDGNGFIDDVNGWNFAYGNNNPSDDEGHGTHVSGIVLGTGENIFASPSGPSHVQIMPLKFLDSTGSGTTSNAISAIYYAANMGAKVMNNSWGGGSYSQALIEAIDYAYQKDVVFVAAAGNSSADNDSSPTYPANYSVPNVVSVAASDSNDYLASFSDYGTQTVPLAAPGVSILSTYPNNTYAYMSGTSMATPFVSGTAALMRYQNPQMNSYQIKQLILEGVDKVGNLSSYVTSGGRLNVNTAVQLVSTTPVNSYEPAYSVPSNGSGSTAGCGLVSNINHTENGDGDGSTAVIDLTLLMLPLVVIFALRTRARPAVRRRYERYSINSSVNLRVGDQDLTGSIRTISVGGSELNTDAMIKDGSVVTMSIVSPDGKSTIQVQGHIVWSAQAKRYGVAFDGIADTIKQTIEGWAQKLPKAS